MKLNETRKTQKFWIKRERLLTRLFTWAFVVAALIVLGLMVYQTAMIILKDIKDLNSDSSAGGPSTGDIDVTQANKQLNAAFSIVDRFDAVVSLTIAFTALFGVVFITRIIANILHIITASHDNKTIIKSDPIFWTRFSKYVLSIVAAAFISIGFLYLAFNVVKPAVQPYQDVIDQITTKIRPIIPSGGVTDAWLNEMHDSTNTNAVYLQNTMNDIYSQFDVLSKNPPKIDGNTLTFLYIIAGGIGLSLINQIVLGSVTLSMTKHFEPNLLNQAEINDGKDKEPEEPKVEEEPKPEEEVKDTPEEETPVEEVKEESKEETPVEDTPTESSEPDSLAKEASEITKKHKSKNKKK